MNDIQVQKSGTLALGKFKATAIGLEVNGSPSYEEWEDCGKFIQRVGKASMFWIGDWLVYGEKKYGETYAQAIEETGFDKHTLENTKWVCDRVENSRRRELLPFALHAEVASLDADEQDEMLEWAEVNHSNRNELRTEIVRRKRKTHKAVIPAGIFDVIQADPPWKYSNSGFEMSAEQKYAVMETCTICEYHDDDGKQLIDSFAPDAVLFLWATNPLLEDAQKVMTAWGFQYKTNIVWVKDSHTAGFYVFGMHELLLIGTRGTSMLPDDDGKPKSILHGTSARHSQKPVEAYETIEAMYPGRSYLEVFARSNRKGWASIGNEN